MKQSDSIQMLKHSIKRNRVKIIVLLLQDLPLVVMQEYRHIIMAGWDKSYITEGD